MAVYDMQTPIAEEDVRRLRVGDVLYITGRIYTARDEAHERALKLYQAGKPLPVDFSGSVIFHCGPIVRKIGERWEIVAAGPTTSTRMEMFEDKFIEAFRVRVIIGKGGMGRRTAEAMKKFGAVYGAFTGGAAVLAANAIKRVSGVEWLDLGMPEALWIMDVERFGPLIVAIDSTGNNLFEHVREEVERNRKRVYAALGL